jgi:purine-binding chemotaxis protein CheW
MSGTKAVNRAAEAQSRLLATFYVRSAVCALDAARVQEVIRLGAITRVRRSAEAILGIINLRGRIVTVLDAGLPMGFPPIEPTPEARVFIIEDRGEFVGLLVDRVGEVVEMDEELLEPLPGNLSTLQGRYLKGVYRAQDRVIALVQVEEMVGCGEA